MLKINPIPVTHLNKYSTYIHGPIQRDEALFLYSLCKMVRPGLIVEFGLQDGLSSLNFCIAKDASCFHYGYDLDENSVNKTKEKCKNYKNCFFEKMNCIDFNSSKIGNKLIDICFLDCSHNLEINKICILKILPCLSAQGILAIHDTGNWSKVGFESAPESFKNSSKLARRFKTAVSVPAVRAEQLTVNWLLESHPEYSQIHFHSKNYFRHGITLIQKKNSL